jgi:hypothetical protein
VSICENGELKKVRALASLGLVALGVGENDVLAVVELVRHTTPFLGGRCRVHAGYSLSDINLDIAELVLAGNNLMFMSVSKDDVNSGKDSIPEP